ncbi:hypothetical protein [Pedobacter nyackensis]|uniref:hypothetical protein n=1 Tax=Pedobacter nyackensis TaxID=475255 RepID=UPI002931C02B|nr:hypothetical protein [Pedobacter nyackensis]
MAKFDGKYLKGLIGKVVVRRGKKAQIIQTVPRDVKQTQATKKAAGVFGQGSILAGTIRNNLYALFGSNYDGEMINRLNTPVRAVLRQCYNLESEQFNFTEDSFSRLAGFEFNSKSLLINQLWVQPKLQYSDNVLTLSIPETQIPAQLKFPATANICKFTLAVSQIALHDGLNHDPLVRQIEIHKNQGFIPAQEFSFDVADGILCIAGIGLNYFALNNDVKTVINNKVFNPAGIIGAIITDGTFILPPPTATPNRIEASPWQPVFNMKI